MKYCLRFIGLCFVILSLPYDGTAQTSPNSRPQRTAAGEICDDGVDNNGDGLIDCNDPACGSVGDCADESANNNCYDGIDNDGDGKIDCADEECNCPLEETICNDGIDNDGDGKIDCADGDCKDFVSCFEGDCNNGVDDDGDGFFDYYDGDCLDDPGNPNDYIIIKPECEARPKGNQFNIKEAWRSDSRTSSGRGMPVVADVDNDGKPEVISYNENNTLTILSGTDGSVERSVTYGSNKASGSYNNPYLVVGEVDNDGYGEIFHVELNGWIRAFNHDLSPMWKTKMSFGLLRAPALADFNNDGNVELYYGNEIRDALTGDLIVKGSHGSGMYPTGNNWQSQLNGLPIAVDILPSSACTDCGGLELVMGHIIYAVDIAGGKLTEALVMDDAATKVNYTGKYYPKEPDFGGQNFSTTAVVDYNSDGYLDVLTSGATGSSKGPTTVFFWDLHNDRVKTFVVSIPANQIHASIKKYYRDLSGGSCGGTEDCTWIRGMGGLNVANIDGDPELECTFMSGSSLYAINQDMEPEWTTDSNGDPVNGNHEDFWESTSGVTGTAVFDFDGDGASEVIYRDQVDLYIVSGENGAVLNSQYTNLTKCSSQTHAEYPIIADVDGDGETEIVLTCSDYENEKYKGSNSGGSRNLQGHIRAYKAPLGQFWVPARRIWNQFAYFNVNVNDNMTIPRYQQPHHLNFSQICSDPNAASKFSLNKFLNQSPRITFCGDLAFPASKLDFADDGVKIKAPVCPEDVFEVTLTFENNGDYDVNQPIPFAFYSQNPTQAYGNSDPSPWLDTLYLSVPGGVKAKQKVDTTVTVRGARGQFTLYVSMNDVGPFDKETKAPIDNATFYPLTQLNGTVRECDGNPTIVAKAVNPIPFELIVTSLDNRRCNDTIGVDNGKIRITDTEGKPLTPLSNYQLTLTNLRTNTAVDISSSVADLDSGTFILGLDSGTYSVAAQYRNNAFSCGSTLDTVTVDRVEGWSDEEMISIEKITDVSSCKPGTADGEARVLVNGGVPDTTKYQVKWQNEQDPNEIMFGATVANLKPVTYNIFVTNLVTGCAVNDSSLTMDLPLPVLDDPVVVPTTSCKTPNGSITARMQQGDINDFDFILIQKSPIQDTTLHDSGVFTGLDEGIYELKAYDPTNDCGLYSEGKTVEITNQAILPNFTLSQVSPQTACDPALANGHLRATPDTPGTYSYEWYQGTITSGSTGSTAADATGLSTYGNTSQLYTVVILDDATGCTLSDTIRLFEQLTYPEIDPADVTTKPLTSCASPNGQISATVGGNATDYTFRLYEGFNASGPYTENATGLFVGLDSIHYTLVAEAMATGCSSTGATQVEIVKVPSGIIYPETLLDITPVNQTSCSSNDPNGQITAAITGGNINDYTFTWYKNVGGILTDVTAAEPTVVINNNQISEVRQGNYVLQITTDSTGCSGQKVITLYDDIVSGDDILLDLTPTAATRCSPPDGSISVTRVQITRDGGTSYTDDAISDYTYRWYEGNDTTTRVDETIHPSALTADLVNVPPGQYTVVANDPNTTCPSIFYTGTVDGPDPLTLSFDPTIHGSSGSADPCIDPDGALKVNIDAGGSGNYTYQWFLGEDTSTPIPGATSDRLSDVRANKYTVLITDLATGCSTDSTFSLGAVANLLPTPATTLKAYVPSTTCDPSLYNGLLEVEIDPAIVTASYSGHNPDEHFFYYWFEGDQVNYKNPLVNPANVDDPANYDVFRGYPSVTGPTGSIVIDNNARIENLAAGEYTVIAIDVKDYVENYKVTGTYDINMIGCRAIDITFVVDEIAQGPSITTVADNNETCPGDGSIVVTAGKRSGDVTSQIGYDFVWIDDHGFTVASSENPANTVSTLANLVGGRYSVTVTDRTTRCDTTFSVDIADNYSISEIDGLTANAVATCSGSDGSVEVTAMTHGESLSNYTFTWYSENYNTSLSPSDATNMALIITDTTPNDQTLTDRSTGKYWVVAQHTTTLCYSLPRRATVIDNSPVMYIPGAVPESFITCTDTNEGSIEVEIMNAPGTVAFKWFTGPNNTTPADEITVAIDNTIPGKSVISNLVAGDYTVQAIDLSGQACPVTATFTVGTRTATPELFVERVQHQTLCSPNGSAQVDKIRLIGDGSAAEDLSNYDFVWYKGSTDASGQSSFVSEYGSNNLISYTTLSVGTYFVQAVPKASFSDGCPTNIAQVTILDESVPLQVIDDFISAPIVACDPSQYAEGEIEIDVINSTNFTTEWYYGTAVDASQRMTSVAPDAVIITNLAPGPYTVRVVDGDTGCEAVRRYIIQGIEVPLAVFPSSQPQISCIENNGAIGVTVNGGRGDYTVNWYAGTTATGTPINANGSFFVENLGSGTYTVAVTDEEDPSCGTVTGQIVVADRTGNTLEITVASDFPMTNCDQSSPNGQLSAAIEQQEDLFRYEFFWYQGSTTSGNPIAFGPTATNLGENSYTVVARDRVTGCISDPFTGAVITLLDSGLLPAPIVRMVSPVTHCANPNGSAEALLDSSLTVDPNVDYEFIWSNAQGEVIFSTDRTNIASQLDTGMYSVIARNTISGCVSAPGKVYVSDSIHIPEFEIVTTPSFCSEPSGTLKIEYYESVRITDIKWTTPYGFNNSKFLDNQPAGKYTATLTNANGCQFTKEAYVLPGIEVYNAVSPNGDQNNDIFRISCIEDFENNLVQIYNRSGSLVYEHVGYDNETIFFNGYGNKGVYVGGKELPDGTYFYIVDKRNGDKPESGYLELLR